MKSYVSMRALTLGFACLAASSVPALGESIVYLETFNWPGGDSQNEALRSVGWCGGIAGNLFCDNPRSGSVSQRDEGPVSSPNYAGDDSFAYWSRAGIEADRSIYADELPLGPSARVSAMWDQSDSSDGPMHLALDFGGDRRISKQSFTHRRLASGDREANTAHVSDLPLSSRTQSGNVRRGSGPESAASGVPSGTIEALGARGGGEKTETSRTDNFGLIAVPLPPAAWLFGSAIVVGVGMLSRRRRKTPDRRYP